MNIKKISFLLLSLLSVGLTAFAQNLEGEGTIENPYLIQSENDYWTFRQMVQTTTTPYYDNIRSRNDLVCTLCAKLMTDVVIDLTQYADDEVPKWQGIAYGDVYYCGTFDGNGHTITYSTVNIGASENGINTPPQLMMFDNLGCKQFFKEIGENTAVVKNLNIDFKSKTYAFGDLGDNPYEGSMPEYFHPIAANAEYARIENIFVSLPYIYEEYTSDEASLSHSSAFVGSATNVSFNGVLVTNPETFSERAFIFPTNIFVSEYNDGTSLVENSLYIYYSTEDKIYDFCPVNGSGYPETKSEHFCMGNLQEDEVRYNAIQLAFKLNGYQYEGVWGVDVSQIIDNRCPAIDLTGATKLYQHGDVVNNTPHEYINGVCKHSDNCFEMPAYSEDYSQWEIWNPGNLLYINENGFPEDYESHAICFMEDIDLSDYNWNSNIYLTANIDGNGKTVKFKSSPITKVIDFEEYVVDATGLFMDVESYAGEISVHDLTIEAMISDAKESVGALFSRLATECYVEINNVTINNFIDGDGNPHGITAKNGAVGGIVGEVNNTNLIINRVIVNIDLKVETDAENEYNSYVGGLVGHIHGQGDYAYSQINSSAYHGTIRLSHLSKGVSYVGGLVGYLNMDSYTDNSYSTAHIIADNATSVGSLVGYVPQSTNAGFHNLFAYHEKGREPLLNGEKTVITCMGNFPDFNEVEDFIPGLPKFKRSLSTVFNAFPSLSEPNDTTVRIVEGGQAAYRFAKTSSYVPVENDLRNVFSHDLSKHKHPVLLIELEPGETQKFTYPTCTPYVYTNEYDPEKYTLEPADNDLKKLVMSYHNPSDFNSMHVCKHGCGRIEEGNWDEALEIEDTEDLVNMVDNLTVLTENSIPVKVVVTDNIVYSDVDYTELTESQLQKSLPAKAPIGTEEKPFIGSFNGAGNELINFAFSQNGLFGQIGQIAAEDATAEEKAEIEEANKNVKVENVSISNGVVYNNLENVVKDLDENNEVSTYYAAALANVNNGVIDYCSFVGAMSIPEGVGEDKVLPCLVGENNGVVSHSFVYFTNLDALSSLSGTDNKAAILVKGNAGIGRSGAGAGQSKKVAANTTSNYSVDEYGQSEESKLAEAECLFSNDEFASGVVAYWLNFEGAGYTGDYTCKYAQGKLTPVLSDGSNGIHRIVYSSNKSATITGQKPYANAGSVLDLSFSEPVSSVKINDVEALRVSDTNYKVTIPNVADADVEVTVTYVAGSTDMETLNPDRTTVVATSEGIRIFGAEGQICTVYALNGAVVYSSALTSNVVILPSVNKGVYFVKVGRTTTKVVL